MSSLRRKLFAIAAAAVAMAGLAASAQADKTLRAVMHSDLKILDPIWTTAYIVRNHGYMIYDTLFATDENGWPSCHSKPSRSVNVWVS
jgi:peptide/nickel transport system substrate-binding protein